METRERKEKIKRESNEVANIALAETSPHSLKSERLLMLETENYRPRVKDFRITLDLFPYTYMGV